MPTRATVGYSGTPLIKKLGLKAGMTYAVVGAPMDYAALLGGLPEGAKRAKSLAGKLDFIHYFAKSKAGLAKDLPKLKKCLAMNGMLWISWPKLSSGVESDVTEKVVHTLGLKTGLVDVKVCAVDETWSGFKFVFRLKDRG